MADNQTFTERLAQTSGLDSTGISSSQTMAVSAGASLDEAKMVGTPAQKRSALAQRIAEASGAPSTAAQREELGRVARLTAAPREPSPEELEAAERANKLSQLGDIGRSIQTGIDKAFAAIKATQPGEIRPAQTALGTALGMSDPEIQAAKLDPNSKYNQVSNILNDFLNSARGVNDQEQLLLSLTNLKNAGLSSADAKQLLGLGQIAMARQTGEAVAANIADEITLADIDVAELGFSNLEDISTALNLAEGTDIGSFTLSELDEAIEVTRKNEFNEINSLKARIANASGLERERLLNELNTKGGAGITGVEALVAKTAEDIDPDETILVGDREFKASELLDDETLGRLVEDYIAADPDKRESIIPSDKFPELIAWINENQRMLGELSNTFGDTIETFEETQKANKDIGGIFDNLDVELSSSLIKSIIPDWDPTTNISSADYTRLVSTLEKSNIGQIANDSTLASADKNAILNKVNQLPPEEMQKFIGRDPDDIMAAHYANEVLLQDRDLANLLNLSGSASGFVFNDADIANINKYKSVIDKIRTTSPGMITLENMPILRELSPEEMEILANNPTRFQTLKDYNNKSDAFVDLDKEDINEVVKFYLDDPTMDLDSLNNLYKEAQRAAKLGDKGALDMVNTINDMFGGKLFLSFSSSMVTPIDQIDSSKLGTILNLLNDKLPTSISDIIQGRADLSGLKKAGAIANKLPLTFLAHPDIEEWQDRISESGTINLASVDGLSLEKLEEFAKFADSKNNLVKNIDGSPTVADYIGRVRKTNSIKSAGRILQEAGKTNAGIRMLGDDLASFRPERIQGQLDTRESQFQSLIDSIRQGGITAAATKKALESEINAWETAVASLRAGLAGDSNTSNEMDDELVNKLNSWVSYWKTQISRVQIG